MRESTFSSPQTATWHEAAPGVWRTVFGDVPPYTLLDAAGALPRQNALQALGTSPFPLENALLEARSDDGKTFLTFPLEDRENIYGLGLDFRRVRQNQTIQTLHADAWGGISGRTHAPTPFYVSSRGYGVLINSPRYLTFYVGTGVRRASRRPPVVHDRNTAGRDWQAMPPSDCVEIVVPAAGVEVLVFAGPTPLEAVRRFNLYTGGGCLPPKWGLGFTTRTPTLYTAEQVTQEVAEFAERGYPLDFVGLEPGWHDCAYPCSFVWDKERFPDPAGFVAAMADKGIRLNLWFNPYIAPSSPLYEKMAPLSGSHTVWNGIVPDYTLPEARKTFASHLKTTITDLGPGIGGFKIDEVDGHDNWLWPDTATFPSGRTAEELRQTYGLLVQRTVHDVFRESNRRTFGLARGTNAGGAGFPFVLYSDSYSFAEYQTALCNSGFCGLLWCPEVRTAKTANEWLRRIQAVCFSPMAMLNAWANGTKPWTFPEVADEVREVMLLRIRLLPYLYTTFAQYYFEGTPPIRPMPLVPRWQDTQDSATEQHSTAIDDTHNPYGMAARSPDVRDQYLLGDALLVAPMPPETDERTVVLPPGRWYDFYTGALVGADSTIMVSAEACGNRLPLFVRDGGIVPLISERQRVPQRGEIVGLDVHHYGDAPGEFLLYDDDGETFAYETGAYSWTRLRAIRNAEGDWQGEVTRPDDGLPFSYSEVTWRFRTP
jgi:alpha-glucosidase (family GH31 glycosyl hydrolase)